MRHKALNKLQNYEVPPKVLYTFGFTLLYIFCVFLFVCNAEAITIVDNSMEPFVFWFTTSNGVRAYFTFIIVLGILVCLTNNFFTSYIVLEILSLFWGCANRIVFRFREQYITIADFDVLGDAAQVEIDLLSYYHPIIFFFLIAGVVNGLLIWLLVKKSKKENLILKSRKSLIIRLLFVLILIICFISMHAKQQNKSLDNVWAFKDAGCVVWFCQNLFGNTTDVITAEEIRDVYNGFIESVEVTDSVSEKRPNIIVIMSEAFWDINNLEGIVEASDNPMEDYYKLVDGAIIGQAATNVYGGGTNRPEFEFLTGINSRYLNRFNCYGQYYIKEQESFVTYLEELGYYTMVFHPYEKSFWDRDVGYANMGFEIFYFEEDFNNREICHGYISDKSLTREIIERFEQQKSVNPEQPIFSFAVSIQNHVDDMNDIDEMSAKEGCTGIEINIRNTQLDEKHLENIEEYYNGMRETIKALEELLNYFESYEEDTVIVFFGDHAPGFVNRLCDTEGKEAEISLYRTPYMIWTNYENDYESYGDMSIPYLSSVLIDYLDLPKPYQYYMNMYMLKHYPINTIYEQVVLDSLDDDRLLDMMSITSTVHKRFPKEEMALPFWQIVE